MALNKVEICGVNTSTLPVLDQEEKAELFKRIKAGDEEARELYIKGNLRLVLSVIRRFQNSSENPDDLFQIGCIGLIKAIDNFDTTLQVKFSTYASSHDQSERSEDISVITTAYGSAVLCGISLTKPSIPGKTICGSISKSLPLQKSLMRSVSTRK